MVLFVFVVMMLNIGEHAAETELDVFRPRAWLGPGLLSAVLLAEVAPLLSLQSGVYTGSADISSKQVAVALFGPYVIGVELASLLLTAGLVGAYHLGRRAVSREEENRGIDTDESRAVSRSATVSAGTGRTSHAA
jgi:NADH-quinone oxidoreductase subunit J